MPGTVSEGNPIAAWWLDHFGWPGLAGFKAGMTVAACILFVGIACRRPAAARWVIKVACVLVAAVVAYSWILTGTVAAESSDAKADSFLIEDEARRLAERHGALLYYRTLANQLAQEVAAGRSTWPEAVRRIAAPMNRMDGNFLTCLRRCYPGRSDAECMALGIVTQALNHLTGRPHEAQQLACRLARTFQAAYGAPLPPRALAALDASPASRLEAGSQPAVPVRIRRVPGSRAAGRGSRLGRTVGG